MTVEMSVDAASEVQLEYIHLGPKTRKREREDPDIPSYNEFTLRPDGLPYYDSEGGFDYISPLEVFCRLRDYSRKRSLIYMKNN
jgi:hypothetical protein